MQLAAKPGFAPSRTAITVAVAILMIGLAASIAFGEAQAAGFFLVLAAIPLCLSIAARNPIIFPFGLYALTVPFDPLLKGSATGNSLTRYVGAATIVALLFHAYRLRRLNAPPRSWYFWGAFMLWVTAGYFWAIEPEQTLMTVEGVGTLFALYTMAAVYPISPRDYVFARRAVILAGTLTAAYGVYGYLHGQRWGTSTRLTLQSGDLQIDPNHYAAFFSIPIAILAARLFLTRSRREAIVVATLLAPMFINVLLTGSRGGLVAVAGALFYAGFRARKFVLLAATSVVGLAITFVVPNVWTRVLDPSQGEASGRAEIWSTGLTVIKHFGLFGSGFGSFAFAYDSVLLQSVQRTFVGYHRPAHNIFVQTLGEVGIPGFILLFAAWWQTIRQNSQIPYGSLYFADRIACEAAMIGIFISALTIDLLWFKYLWLAMMLVLMLANAYRPRLLVGRLPVTRPQRAMPGARVRVPVRL
jgi:O-antigen ligase